MCVNIFLVLVINFISSITFFIIGYLFYEYNFFKVDKVRRNRRKLNKMLENKQSSPQDIMAAIRFIRESKA
jgi:hypothetical protein